MNLSLRIRRDYASYPAEIKSVHTDDTIEPVVVFASNLSGCLALVECYAVLPQAASCRRIYGIADFFRGRGGAFDVIFALKPVGVQKRFENKLRHRRAADIAVAYKQYSNHNCAKIGKYPQRIQNTGAVQGTFVKKQRKMYCDASLLIYLRQTLHQINLTSKHIFQ